MSKLELTLEDWEAHDTSSLEFEEKPNPNAEWDYAYSTDFRSTTVFKHLRDYMQPDTDITLWETIYAILRVLPDAPLSTEAYMTGLVILEVAEQIPWHHPSQRRLAQVVHVLTTSSKLSKGHETVSSSFDHCY
jgi:hypothetical protein